MPMLIVASIIWAEQGVYAIFWNDRS